MAKATDRAALNRASPPDSDATPATRGKVAPSPNTLGLIRTPSRWRREYSYIAAVILIVSIFGFVFFGMFELTSVNFGIDLDLVAEGIA